MSYEAVRWALYDAPMLLTSAGRPDIAARFVLLARAERADKHGRNTYAGPADLMKTTGYDERTIQRADRRLEVAGLLIRDGFSHVGTVKWRVDMSRKQGDDVRAIPDPRIEQRRKADALRQQRHRSRQKAAAADPDPAGSIEGDPSTKNGVTESASVMSRSLCPDVTESVSGCHGRSAPQTTNEPPMEPPIGTAPGGAPPPDPRRRPPTSSSANEAKRSLTGPLTQAQDQQGESLPHANARGPSPAGPHLATVIQLPTREAS